MSKQKRVSPTKKSREYSQNNPHKAKIVDFLKKSINVESSSKFSNLVHHESARITPSAAWIAKQKVLNETFSMKKNLYESTDENMRLKQKLNGMDERIIKKNNELQAARQRSQQNKKRYEKDSKSLQHERSKQKSQHTLVQLLNSNKSLLQKIILMEKSMQGDSIPNQVTQSKFYDKNQKEFKRQAMNLNSIFGAAISRKQKKQVQKIETNNTFQRQQINQKVKIYDEVKNKNRQLQQQNMKLKKNLQILQTQLRVAQEKYKYLEDDMKRYVLQYNLIKQQQQRKDLLALETKLEFEKRYNQMKFTFQNQLLKEKKRYNQLEKAQYQIQNQLKGQLQNEKQIRIQFQNQANENIANLQKKLLKEKENANEIQRRYNQIKQTLQDQISKEKNSYVELQNKLNQIIKKLKSQLQEAKQNALLLQNELTEKNRKLETKLENQKQKTQQISAKYNQTINKLQLQLLQEKNKYFDLQQLQMEIKNALKIQLQQENQKRLNIESEYIDTIARLQKKLQKQHQNKIEIEKIYNQFRITSERQLLQEKKKNKDFQIRYQEIVDILKLQLEAVQQQFDIRIQKQQVKLQKEKETIIDLQKKYNFVKIRLQQELVEQRIKNKYYQKRLKEITNSQKLDALSENMFVRQIFQMDSNKDITILDIEGLQSEQYAPKIRSIVTMKEQEQMIQYNNEGSVKADIKEILTYRMIDNHLTRAQIIERINSSCLTRLTYAKLFSMLTAYPFSLTPYYAVEFLKSCFGYAKIPQNAQIKKQDFIKSIEEFVQDFQLRDTAEVEKMLKEIGQFIVQNRKKLQEKFSVAGAKDKCIDKQTLIKHLREVGNFSEDKAHLVISHMSSKCEYLDKINYQQLFYEFDVNNSFKITKYMKELLTYRMKYNRLTFQQLKTSIKDKKFTFGQLQAILREYPFKLSADYAKEFLKAIYHKQQNISDQTVVDVNIFINYLSYVVEDFQLPTEQQQRQQIQKIAEIMFKNRYSLENQFQYLRSPQVADKMQRLDIVNQYEMQNKFDISFTFEDDQIDKTVTKSQVINVLQKIGLNIFQIQLALCRLAAKCQHLDRINYQQLCSFFKLFNIYLCSSTVKQIRQIVTYRMKYNQLQFSELESDLKNSKQTKISYKRLLAHLQSEPFCLSLHFAQEFLKICYGKQNILSEEYLYIETLINHLRNVIDDFQLSPMTVAEQKQILLKISKIITDNRHSISNYFRLLKKQIINKNQLEQILNKYLSDKRQVQLAICKISMKCKNLSQITQRQLFEQFFIDEHHLLKKIQKDSIIKIPQIEVIDNNKLQQDDQE